MTDNVQSSPDHSDINSWASSNQAAARGGQRMFRAGLRQSEITFKIALNYCPAPAMQVSTGLSHTCAINSTGDLSCWGRNDPEYGGTVPPPGLGKVKQVAAGWGYTCVLKADSSVACWGTNSNGQLHVPPGLGPAAMVSAGSTHACALTTSGTVRCWGSNDSGESSDEGPIEVRNGAYVVTFPPGLVVAAPILRKVR